MFAVIQSQTIIPTWMTKSPMCRFRWKLTSNVEWSPTTGYNDGNSNFKLDKSLYKYIINSWASNFTKIQTNKQEHSLLIIISYHGWGWQSHYQWVSRSGQTETVSYHWQYWLLFPPSTDKQDPVQCNQLKHQKQLNFLFLCFDFKGKSCRNVLALKVQKIF